MAIQQAAIDKRGGGVAPAEKFDTVVVGGGQAGLSVGYYLKRDGGSFVILDANERIGAPGGRARGTRSACSRPRATTACRAGRFRRRDGRIRPPARRPITSRPMRLASSCRCEAG
jgi:glycine/D-amino acid oxidase-like deaminating enzyme